jgi:hypothetical protein
VEGSGCSLSKGIFRYLHWRTEINPHEPPVTVVSAHLGFEPCLSNKTGAEIAPEISLSILKQLATSR